MKVKYWGEFPSEYSPGNVMEGRVPLITPWSYSKSQTQNDLISD